MTPTEQDKELRRHCDSLGVPSLWYDKLIDIVQADRKKHELKARIDEIKLTKDNSEESYLGEDWWADESIKDNSAHEVPLSYFDNRIAELKQELESYE